MIAVPLLMIAVPLLIPVSMLCLLLALGRYEERMLGPAGPEEAPDASDRPRLRAVPGASPGTEPLTPRPAGSETPRQAA
ncbi:hypothetical protein ABZ876_24050 [Streptomyces sp. NPDC046931]|uniref:hypothetical protein n=1 Tax=Streptomyces sp. NPDC046931 TaxID=3154806 RepID=UPI0033C2C6AD